MSNFTDGDCARALAQEARAKSERISNAESEAREDAPLILSLDTATGTRSVAVARGAQLLSLIYGAAKETGAMVVLPEVEKALQQAGVHLREIELFAAASGPGSFTGLRVGLATVKGLAATLGRPCLGVPTLQAIARAAGPSGRTLALLPAGRGEVFAQTLSASVRGATVELDEPSHLPPEELCARAAARGESLLWAGSGAHAIAALIRARARAAGILFRESGSGAERAATDSGEERGAAEGEEAPRVWTLVERERTEILAPRIAALAWERWRAGIAQSAAELRAIYARPSDAELKELCRAQS